MTDKNSKRSKNLIIKLNYFILLDEYQNSIV